MLTALLQDGKIVHAVEYSENKHGFSLRCIDPACRAPVIHVGEGMREDKKRTSAYFKTVGKDADSKHTPSCGFFEPLEVVDAIEKIALYQSSILQSEGVPKQIINLNLKRLDPDYVSREPNDRREKTEDKDDKVKVKDDREIPGTIGSLKNVVKLLVSYEPDILASIYLNIGGGRKLPLSHVIMGPDRAYDLLWEDQSIPRMNYFVYGKFVEVTKLEKVMYMDFTIDDEERPFTVVIFADYFKYFHYEKNDLIGKDFLVYGELRKNTYNNIKKGQIIIKSGDYLERIKPTKKQ